MTNPLISIESHKETIQNASEALEALMILLADQHSGLCRLLAPIAHAIAHVADAPAPATPPDTPP